MLEDTIRQDVCRAAAFYPSAHSATRRALAVATIRSEYTVTRSAPRGCRLFLQAENPRVATGSRYSSKYDFVDR